MLEVIKKKTIWMPLLAISFLIIGVYIKYYRVDDMLTVTVEIIEERDIVHIRCAFVGCADKVTQIQRTKCSRKPKVSFAKEQKFTLVHQVPLNGFHAINDRSVRNRFKGILH